MRERSFTLHANCVLLDDQGVLVRGPSGSGKSALSRALLSAASNRGWFARLVSDDRTKLVFKNGRLIARSVDPLQGMLEIRGVGIVHVPVQQATVLRLVIDLAEEAPRMPEPQDHQTNILSVCLPRLVQRRGEMIADYVLSYLCGEAKLAPDVHL